MLAYALTLGGLYAFIVLVDPFDVLPLSLPLERRPVAGNQRFAFPGLARKAEFDSAVVGSSTVMLLDPEELSRDLGRRFVTLAMGAAKHLEQRSILGVFARNHPHARTVILSVDSVWLRSAENRKRQDLYRVPDWMYDANPWNDYAHHFDLYTVEKAGRQLGQIIGIDEPTFRRDGYRRFVPATVAYDTAKVHENLYGPVQRAKTEAWKQAAAENVEFEWEALDEALALLPASTEKILLLPPLHVVAHPPLAVAKRTLVERMRAVPNLRIVDFLFPSSLTKTDSNYWDPQHYTAEIATEISRLLAESRNPAFESDVCRVLLRTPAPD